MWTVHLTMCPGFTNSDDQGGRKCCEVLCRIQSSCGHGYTRENGETTAMMRDQMCMWLSALAVAQKNIAIDILSAIIKLTQLIQ